MSVQTRDKRLHFINTGTAETPVFSLVNEGVTTFNDSLEIQSEDVHYVAEQNARSQATGYKPQIEYELGLDPDDDVDQMLYQVGADQVLGATITMVTVDTWDGTSPDFTARQGVYQVQPSQAGSGDPGAPLTVGGTLIQVGELVSGTFDVTTKTFTPATTTP